MRILDVINKTTPFFEKRGVESPRLTIELLLAHVLGKKRLELYLEFEREVDNTQLESLRELVRRRADGEPIQYITGEAEFHGLKFLVDRRVLIPRPETELLVETVLQDPPGAAGAAPVLVDLCTGSGCIAVTLATRCAGAIVYALDVSEDALAVARMNAERHGVEKNIRFFRGDLLQALPENARADAIVSNPPYVATGDLAALPKEVRDFEPWLALDAGKDGLDVYGRIAAQAAGRLTSSGRLYLELGAGQRAAVEDILGAHGFNMDRVVRDLQGHDRVLVARVAGDRDG
jgi:release factor glutamine methyltransferase